MSSEGRMAAPAHYSLEVLGAGSSGCVVRPAPACDDELSRRLSSAARHVPSNRIGKVVFSKKAMAGLVTERAAISNIDPDSDFTFPQQGDVCVVSSIDREAVVNTCLAYAETRNNAEIIEEIRKAADDVSLPLYQLKMAGTKGDVYRVFATFEATPFSFWAAAIKRLIENVAILTFKGIIHGDLKPANIAIGLNVKSSYAWTLALIDFGSAVPLRSVLGGINSDKKKETLEKMATKAEYPYTPPECCYLDGATIKDPACLYYKIAETLHRRINFVAEKQTAKKQSAIMKEAIMQAVKMQAAKMQPYNNLLINVFIALGNETNIPVDTLDAGAFNVYQLGVTIAEILMLVMAHVKNEDELNEIKLAIVPLSDLLSKMCARDPRMRTEIRKCKTDFANCFSPKFLKDVQYHEAHYFKPGTYVISHGQ